MDDSDGSPILENGEVLEWSVASAAAGGSGAHRSYGSTVAKQRQPMESKTPGSARKVQGERRALARAHKCPESLLHIEGERGRVQGMEWPRALGN